MPPRITRRSRPIKARLTTSISSAYLPYCDAMLVDNRTRAMMAQGVPRKYAVNYPCRLFSPKVGSEFLDYLKSVEEEADPLILSLVRQVYGENWLKPFVTMFDA